MPMGTRVPGTQASGGAEGQGQGVVLSRPSVRKLLILNKLDPAALTL